MMYKGRWSRARGLCTHCLTWDDLDDTGLLHVGWQVSRPHVLLHDSHVGQFLQPRNVVRGKHDRPAAGDLPRSLFPEVALMSGDEVILHCRSPPGAHNLIPII